MKKLTCFVLTLLLPLLAYADPDVHTLTVYRVWVKDGHSAAFEKAVAAHAKQFHTGHWKWRVYQVLSGPDGGSYQINEGPNSWTDLEGRGDLGAAHNKNYETTLLPHISKSSPEAYMEFQDKHSTTPLGNYSAKALITHAYVKPGRMPAYMEALKTNKAVWEKRGYNVAVWRSFASGPAQVGIVYRLKNGFKDFDIDDGPYKAAYDEINGAGSYDKYLEEIVRDVESYSSDMIEYSPNLSSPAK
jgi:hypothetical protein